ncbi:MAG: glycosyltransferase family 9 protein [Acidobacteriota bacterium]
MGQAILVVRLSALGDLVHAVPAVEALRHARPDARVDWLVDARYAAFLEHVPGLDGVMVVGAPRTDALERAGRSERRFGGGAGILHAVRSLRARRYDVAVDLQGLIKSAAWARLSGARRIVGFTARQVRERAAALLYTDRVDPRTGGHVIDKNLALAAALGADAVVRRLDLIVPPSAVLAEVRSMLGAGEAGGFAILNPGAGWPNKRWDADRFGAVATHLRDMHGLPAIVTWGPGERELASTVVSASQGAAWLAPATNVGDLLALCRACSLFVAGDTGPLQLAAAVGAPIVGIFGPTDPVRNGPWAPADLCLSAFDRCECHHKHRCRRAATCLRDITVPDVMRAVDERLARETARG